MVMKLSRLFFSLLLIFLLGGCTSLQTEDKEPVKKNQRKDSSITEKNVKIKKQKRIRFDPKTLKTNQQCISLLKQYEGLRLKAYLGLGGHWLIGYGHSEGVKKGMTITRLQAEQILVEDLKKFESNVARLTKVNLTENEFSALVCLAYNIGWGNLARSTLLQRVNMEDWQGAANAFLMWKNIKGIENQVLYIRRKRERELFLKP